MKAIFYVLALLVTGAAAYFSFENLNKFEGEKATKEAAIAKNKIISGNADKQQVALDEEKVKLDTASKDKADAEASIENLVAKEKTLRRDLGVLEGELEEQKAKFAELEKARAEIENLLKEAGEDVTLDNLAEKISAMEAEKLAKTKSLDELESNVASATRTVESNQGEIGRLADRSATRNSRISRNAMESVVSAVNDDWGFVIIGAGSNTGFTPQTKLLVKRDGRLIAEIKPSSIEPSQTIAEIDPETLAPGARIQPGDRVILANPATN
jgi:predicted RNase H-like nuclease (RuvC/YqgF family)